MKKSYVGIDYSLNSPAMCVIKDDVTHLFGMTKSKRVVTGVDGFRTGDFQVSVVGYPSYRTETERYVKIAQAFVYRARQLTHDTSHFGAMEGYSIRSRNRAFRIGEHGGVLKALMLMEAGIELEELAPTSVKKHAGKGSYDKSEMANAFHAAHGFFIHELLDLKDKFEGPGSDLVDAYFIASLAREKHLSDQ